MKKTCYYNNVSVSTYAGAIWRMFKDNNNSAKCKLFKVIGVIIKIGSKIFELMLISLERIFKKYVNIYSFIFDFHLALILKAIN